MLLVGFFVLINDVIRPRFRGLDLVLTNYQDLALITSLRLFWPKQLSWIIVAFHLALFDVELDGDLDVFCANGFITGELPFDT